MNILTDVGVIFLNTTKIYLTVKHNYKFT